MEARTWITRQNPESWLCSLKSWGQGEKVYSVKSCNHKRVSVGAGNATLAEIES